MTGLEESASVADRILGLINKNCHAATPKTRDDVLAFYRPRLEAMGLGCGGEGLERALGKKIIHVAGTKGKGSTCAFLESILRTAGYKTGLFTSPHLVRPHERIRIGGQPVLDSVLEEHFEKLMAKLHSVGPLPNFFGILMLLSFSIFAAHDLDVIILEVGIGGRLDSTNVIERPSATAITLLDLDHLQILGNSIELIAAEKAGIFKRDVPVLISAGQEAAAVSVLEAVSRNVGSGQVSIAPIFPMPNTWKLGINGDYQCMNAGLAVALCSTLYNGEKSIPNSVIKKGLEQCSWPGRGQIQNLHGRGMLYLDGAHTPKSMLCAVDWFKKETSCDMEVILLFFCMHSRNPVPLFEALMAKESGLQFSKVVFAPTLFEKPARINVPSVSDVMIGNSSQHESFEISRKTEDGTWVEVLAELWRRMFKTTQASGEPEQIQQVVSYNSLNEALDAIGLTNKNDNLSSDSKNGCDVDNSCRRVFVTGSIILVGNVLELLEIQV